MDSARRSPPKTLYIKSIYMSNHRGKIVLGQNLRLEAEASDVLQDPRFSTMTVETTEKVTANLVLLKHDGHRFLLRDRRIIFRATLDVGHQGLLELLGYLFNQIGWYAVRFLGYPLVQPSYLDVFGNIPKRRLSSLTPHTSTPPVF